MNSKELTKIYQEVAILYFQTLIVISFIFNISVPDFGRLNEGVITIAFENPLRNFRGKIILQHHSRLNNGNRWPSTLVLEPIVH